MNIKGWNQASLSDLAAITMGSSPPSSGYNADGKGLPLIQGNADIKKGRSFPLTVQI